MRSPSAARPSHPRQQPARVRHTTVRLAFSLALLLALVHAAAAPAVVVAQDAPALAPPAFSVQRGFHRSPFQLQLSAAEGAAIRYTLDGSAPSPSRGTLYEGPIGVSSTTVVRAIAYRSRTDKSALATHTYLFLAAVRRQADAAPPGWPATFAAADSHGTYPADYGMDPEVWDHPNNSAKFEQVMQALPSLSIVTDLPNLWDTSSGIYYNANAKEPDDPDPLRAKWERPISLEWINPDGSTGFAESGGMRINGQSSRRPHRQPKKSFRIYFKAAYGTPKLDFQLFDHDDAVAKFDRIVLRNGGNRTWPYFDRDQRRYTDYINDEWARRAWLRMGNLAPHGTYVHLYLNGLYWGLYNVTERIDEKFIQAYIGGNEADIDYVEADEDLGDIPVAESGTLDAYNELLSLVAGNQPITNAQYQTIARKVDVANLADYFVHVHYIGKTDWPHHNWNAYRSRVGPDTRFKFIPWDNDTGLNKLNENNTLATDTVGPADAPVQIFLRLTTNPEFRQVLADRLFKHVVDPTGNLTPASCAALYGELAAIVDQAVIGESARWGDYMRDTYPRTNDAPKGFPAYLHTRDLPDSYTDPANAVADNVQTTWVDVRDDKLNSYCPNRGDVLVGQYVGNGWYQTTVKPPAFTQAGGAVSARYALGLSNSPNGGAGEIFYTIDGGDPRAAFGAVAAGAVNGGDQATITIGTVTTVRARVLSGGVWSPLAEYTFYPPQPFENLVINEIHYHPVPPASPAGLKSSDYEFLELYNRGATPLRLDNVSFSRGMSFRFPPSSAIGPGQFLVLASDPASFQARYGFAAYGGYRGNLSNGGEALELVDAVGGAIDFVDYKTRTPWPREPDGGGGSLSLSDPAADNSLAGSWRTSHVTGGTPGAPNGDFPVELRPAAELAPAELAFGPQEIGHPGAAKSVTLTSVGTAPLELGAISAGGDFAASHTCPASLAPGASCTIAITFTAGAAGARSGGLTVASNAEGSPHRVALSGAGARLLTMTASQLRFDGQRVGTTSPARTVTLTNTGAAPVSGLTMAASGPFAQTSGCGASLAPGASCQISVTYRPTAAGAHTGALSVRAGPRGSVYTITLAGTTAANAPLRLYLPLLRR